MAEDRGEKRKVTRLCHRRRSLRARAGECSRITIASSAENVVGPRK